MAKIDFDGLKRDDIRRTLSCVLMDTSEENKMQTDIWIEREGREAKVVYLYQVPCSGEIGVGVDYSGCSEEQDFEEFDTDIQREILEEVFDGLYKPCTLMEKNTGNNQVTPLLVVGLHQLKGGAYFLIDETLRNRLGEELKAYERTAATEGLTCGGDFYLLTKSLSCGKKGLFLGREYYFEYTDDQNID